jgi:hypothetical protein
VNRLYTANLVNGSNPLSYHAFLPITQVWFKLLSPYREAVTVEATRSVELKEEVLMIAIIQLEQKI